MFEFALHYDGNNWLLYEIMLEVFFTFDILRYLFYSCIIATVDGSITINTYLHVGL